jgi:Tfp pilus assembly protein PilO
MEIKKRLQKINLLASAGVIVALAGTALFAVKPLFSAGMKSINDAADYRAQIDQLNILNLKVARAQEQQKERDARLKEVEARLPNVAAVNQFVPELAKVAEAAGLQVDNVTPIKEVKDSGDYKLLSVNVTGRGDWDTCYKFLTGLRASNRKLTRLDSISLDVNKEQSAGLDRPVCRISVDISTFMAR